MPEPKAIAYLQTAQGLVHTSHARNALRRLYWLPNIKAQSQAQAVLEWLCGNAYDNPLMGAIADAMMYWLADLHRPRLPPPVRRWLGRLPAPSGYPTHAGIWAQVQADVCQRWGLPAAMWQDYCSHAAAANTSHERPPTPTRGMVSPDVAAVIQAARDIDGYRNPPRQRSGYTMRRLYPAADPRVVNLLYGLAACGWLSQLRAYAHTAQAIAANSLDRTADVMASIAAAINNMAAETMPTDQARLLRLDEAAIRPQHKAVRRMPRADAPLPCATVQHIGQSVALLHLPRVVSAAAVIDSVAAAVDDLADNLVYSAGWHWQHAGKHWRPRGAMPLTAALVDSRGKRLAAFDVGSFNAQPPEGIPTDLPARVDGVLRRRHIAALRDRLAAMPPPSDTAAWAEALTRGVYPDTGLF